MRIVSHNVNGARARLKANYEAAIAKLDPDILCIQETRARPDQLPKVLFNNAYKATYSIHSKPGYAGATTFCKAAPFLHTDDFPGNDEPGRVSISDFKSFKLINAYVPNSGQRLEKIEHRMEWQKKLATYISQQMKPVIFCGDINCAPLPIDTACPSIKAGCSFQERSAYQDLLNLGLVDVFRELNPNKAEYTWFSNTHDSRAANRGMRIDAFIISKELLPFVTDMRHIYDPELICGSDHNPILLEINI